MIEKNFFVILNDQQGNPVPMADPEGIIYFLDSYEKAVEAAENTFFGENFGYGVFDLDQPL